MHAPHVVIALQKKLAPGVSVRIAGVPATVHGDRDAVHAMDVDTASHVEQLLLAARRRMANGETDIRFDFADEG
jgi:hypothetical protein